MQEYETKVFDETSNHIQNSKKITIYCILTGVLILVIIIVAIFRHCTPRPFVIVGNLGISN